MVSGIVFFPLGIPIFAKDGKNTILSLIFHALQIGVILWECTHSKQVRDYVRAHRSQLRVFFLPKRAPEYNPDEQVWNEVKNNRIGKQPVKNKEDLTARLTSALDSLKQNTRRIISFFHLPDTKYAAGVA